jgi:L-malate glycosyltransferase
VSNLGGIPEFIEHKVNGWMADPLDAEDFARWIVEALKNPQEAEKLGIRAKESINTKCADEKVWNQTCSMYQNLLR